MDIVDLVVALVSPSKNVKVPLGRSSCPTL